MKTPEITNRETDIDYILRIVCDYYHVSREDINNPSRKTEYRLPRQIAHYFAKKYIIRMTLGTIGSKIGNRPHCSVIYSIKTIQNLIDTNKIFRAQMEEIERRIKG